MLNESTIKSTIEDVITDLGQRITIMHALDSKWVIVIIKQTLKIKAFYEETIAEHVENQFQNYLLPIVLKNSGIVGDNAHNHSRRVYKAPNRVNNKKNIQEYLLSRESFFKESNGIAEPLKILAAFKIEKQYVCNIMTTTIAMILLYIQPN